MAMPLYSNRNKKVAGSPSFNPGGGKMASGAPPLDSPPPQSSETESAGGASRPDLVRPLPGKPTDVPTKPGYVPAPKPKRLAGYTMGPNVRMPSNEQIHANIRGQAAKRKQEGIDRKLNQAKMEEEKRKKWLAEYQAANPPAKPTGPQLPSPVVKPPGGGVGTPGGRPGQGIPPIQVTPGGGPSGPPMHTMPGNGGIFPGGKPPGQGPVIGGGVPGQSGQHGGINPGGGAWPGGPKPPVMPPPPQPAPSQGPGPVPGTSYVPPGAPPQRPPVNPNGQVFPGGYGGPGYPNPVPAPQRPPGGPGGPPVMPPPPQPGAPGGVSGPVPQRPPQGPPPPPAPYDYGADDREKGGEDGLGMDTRLMPPKAPQGNGGPYGGYVPQRGPQGGWNPGSGGPGPRPMPPQPGVLGGPGGMGELPQGDEQLPPWMRRGRMGSQFYGAFGGGQGGQP